MNKLDQILSSQALAGRVRRWHCWNTISQQSVGEHSHRVATLYIELFGVPRVEVLCWILYHDLGELYAGDSPFGAKRDIPTLKNAVNQAEEKGLAKLGITMPELVGDEWVKFKIADLTEMWEFSYIERRQGNLYADPVMQNITNALTILTKDHPALRMKVMGWIDKKRTEFYE